MGPATASCMSINYTRRACAVLYHDVQDNRVVFFNMHPILSVG